MEQRSNAQNQLQLTDLGAVRVGAPELHGPEPQATRPGLDLERIEPPIVDLQVIELSAD
ncbi:hypothetical protein [Thiorhodococcus minor]|uniref:Uncharacterized protein n=1 Tax=Thiorhodococcus minor TaxID=57489 RepID=A0A6M0K567_9GAMM|nr:hypothetical protein [Thiorhodococcus minor]NEV64404.1 hypothetical protein [Thiorhodococcus minor]